MSVIDMPAELRELEALHRREVDTQAEVRRRVRRLRRAGASLRSLGEAVGLSESQVSRVARQPATEGSGLPALTAMELVRRAERGEIGHDELVGWLMVWPYEPSYVTMGLGDDWEWRDNSFDAVGAAYFGDLITDEDYERILAGSSK